MAAVVLGLAGLALGGPLGGAVGATLGGLIDQTILIPELFGNDVPVNEQPRWESLRLQNASEGAAVFKLYGASNRIAGTVIWISKVRVVKTEEEVGGKGGTPSGINITYQYFVDLAIAIGKGPINAVIKILADDKNIATLAKTVAVTSGDALIDNVALPTYKKALLKAVIPGLDLPGFVRDLDITVSGFSNSENNGTFFVEWVKEASFVDSTVVQFRIRRDTDVFIDESGASVNLLQVQPEFFNLCNSVVFHDGSETQTADAIIEAEEEDVPAFRGTSYIVIENMNLTEFGGRIPNFTLFVEADPVSPIFTVGDCIARILTEAGLLPSQFDATACVALLRGYVVSGPQPTIQQLEPLLLAYDLIIVEREGVLTFKPRGESDTGDIDNLFLGAVEGDSPDIPDAEFEDRADFLMPQEVTIEHLDSEQDLQPGAQRERLIDSTQDNIEKMRLPLTLSPTEARAIAQRLLWQSRAENLNIKFSLPPSYIWIKEYDRLTLVFLSETYIIRVTQVLIGANRVVEVSGIVERPFNTELTPAVDSNIIITPSIYRPPTLVLHILDLPPLTGGEIRSSGFYWAVAAADPSALYLGGTLFDSGTDIDFGTLALLPPETTMGIALSVLADAPSIDVWDEISVVQIELHEGTLSSATKDQVLSGSNTCIIGDEIIGFRTATLISENIYDLSGLWRGRRDTSDHSVGHVLVERFVLLTGLLEFGSINTAQIGNVRFYRPTPSGEDVANVSSVSHTHEAETLRTFRPKNVSGERDGSNDLTIVWMRSSRDILDALDPSIPALVDGVEQYEIDFFTPGFGSIVRTVVVDNVETYLYTAADQSSDGLTPGDPVSLRIYQISPTLGRGNETEVIV